MTIPPEFEIRLGGDPYSDAWECNEYKDAMDMHPVHRGDISGVYGREELIAYLRRNYPGSPIYDGETDVSSD